MYKYAINSHETTTKPKASFSFCGFAMIIIIAIRTNKSCKNSIFSPCFDLFWNDNFIQPKLKFNHCVLYSAQRQRAKRRNDKKGGAGNEADSAVRSKITIAASAKGYDDKKAEQRADGRRSRRRRDDKKDDGREHRRYDSENRRRSSKSAATGEAARGYKFYRPHKLHSHLVAPKSNFKLKFLNDPA